MSESLPQPRRLRIIHTVLELTLGGAESMVGLLARNLDPRRFRVEVWGLDAGGENERLLREAGISVRILGKGHGFRLEFLRSLRNLISAARPDVIHAHNTPAARWSVLGTVGLANPPALVRTEHTFNSARRLEYLVSHAVLGGHFHRIIGVSEDTTRRHRRLDPLWRGRYVTIPNGIQLEGGRSRPDPDRNLRSVLGFDSTRRYIFNLGNLRAPKGQDTLLRAFAGVARRHSDVRLIILGEGPLRGALESLRQELKLADRVQLMGHRSDAADLLAAADLIVQSSNREGLPVSLLEAARVCRPIVATDVGGTREIIHDGETGLLVAANDVGALENAMHRMLEDRSLASRLALAARKFVFARHDIRKTAEATGCLYETIVR